MSNKNSKKELIGVYRRCLSALNQSYKVRHLTSDTVGRIERQVAKEAPKQTFDSTEEWVKWTNKRFSQLYFLANCRLAKDPNGTLKAQINQMISSAE